MAAVAAAALARPPAARGLAKSPRARRRRARAFVRPGCVAAWRKSAAHTELPPRAGAPERLPRCWRQTSRGGAGNSTGAVARRFARRARGCTHWRIGRSRLPLSRDPTIFDALRRTLLWINDSVGEWPPFHCKSNDPSSVPQRPERIMICFTAGTAASRMGKRGRGATESPSSATRVEAPSGWPGKATRLGLPHVGVHAQLARVCFGGGGTPCFLPLDRLVARKVGDPASASTARLTQNDKQGAAAPKWDHPPPARLFA